MQSQRSFVMRMNRSEKHVNSAVGLLWVALIISFSRKGCDLARINPISTVVDFLESERHNVQNWKQVYCDAHGQEHLIWIENPTNSWTPFTVVCSECEGKLIGHADIRLAADFAKNVPNMNIRTRTPAS